LFVHQNLGFQSSYGSPRIESMGLELHKVLERFAHGEIDLDEMIRQIHNCTATIARAPSF
jgi:hypothetical protein